MRMLILPCLLAPFAAWAADASPAAPGEPFKPMAFLAGHCWKGTFPDQPQTDEHCFEWVYGGRFLRDRHVVHGAGHPDYLGETTYYWDAAARQIQYLYIESDGGYSRGAAEASADGLKFPETSEVEGATTRTYRSRWQHHGDDAFYDVVTEFKAQDAWTVAWKVRMQKQPAP